MEESSITCLLLPRVLLEPSLELAVLLVFSLL